MIQACILATDIVQNPTKSQVISGESCFITDPVVRREIKRKIIKITNVLNPRSIRQA